MLPSRGLRWSSQTVGIGRRRIEPFAARNFSSSRAIKASPCLSTKSAAFPRANTSFSISRTALLLRNATGVRFASTAPASTIVHSSATPTLGSADAASSSAVNLPTGSFDSAPRTTFESAVDFSADSLLDIPEQIGYLKSLGLDHGYGPTSVMQWALEHIHIYAGTPWWVSIALTAVAVRVLLFKPFMGAAENGARMATIMPITKPITEKMKEAARNGDSALTMELRRELQRMNARAGIQVWKSFVPMVQVFFGIGTFICLRAMSALPVPGLETGGILWFYNLTVPDPLYLLPLATASILHWVIRERGEMGVNTMDPKLQKAFMWGMPFLTLVFTSWLPAAVQLSFLTSGILSYFQASVFKQPWFRSRFNMTPLPQKKSPTGPLSPYKGNIRRGPLSSSELGNRFEGPKGANGKSGLLSGLKDTIGSIQDAGKGVMEMGKGQMEKSAQKNTLKQRQAYEVKRREEIKRAKREDAEERRVERAMRKGE